MNFVSRFICPAVLILMMFNAVIICPALAFGKVEVFNHDSAQFVITSVSSPNIYIDVIDSSYLQEAINENDILLVTHSHPDHYDKGFCDNFPGRGLIFEEGRIDFSNGRAVSISSTHTEKQEDKFLSKDGSNYIEVVDIDGLRIVHFGDIGQKEFTKEQINILGHVDIAIMQFINPLSEMDLENMKAFRLMEAISPSIIIPTAHGRFAADMIKVAKEKWNVYASEEMSLSFSKDELPSNTTLLVWGDGASFIMDDLNLSEWLTNK